MTAVQVFASVAIIEIVCVYMVNVLGWACLDMIARTEALEGIPGVNRDLMGDPAKRARRNVLKAMALMFVCAQLMAAPIAYAAPVWLTAAALGIGGTVFIVTCWLLIKLYIDVSDFKSDYCNVMHSQRELALLDRGRKVRRRPVRISRDQVLSNPLMK